MERPRGLSGMTFGEAVIMDSEDSNGRQQNAEAAPTAAQFRSPMTSRTRSLSDSTGTPSKLSPSPRIVETSRRTSKDDSSITHLPPPETPRRSELRGLSIQMPPRQSTPPPGTPSGAYIRPAPLSPKLDHSHTYASPTNLLPRRSRGLDFSRAATSLHHSMLAEQPSDDLSPMITDRAMNIPPRRGPYGGTEQTSTSLWSMMGNQERLNISTSLGSNHAHAPPSDSSSSSSEDDDMDEDMDEAYVTTPQVSKMGMPPAPGSPSIGSLASFQHRQRHHRKHPKMKPRGPLGLGFNLASAVLSKSPPSNSAAARARRESISWQANQLHISSGDMDEGGAAEGSSSDQRNVIRRVVTRRGNLLPKAKAFARIRAALAEEGAPAEAEFIREAEIVKQVRESDVDLEPRHQPTGGDTNAMTTAHSSPNLVGNQETLEDIPADDSMGELGASLSSSFKQHAMKNSKGKQFWDTFSESSGARTPPPSASAFLPRGSSSGMSEDTNMDSPSLSSAAFHNGQLPSAAEITRRINNKRRRDDDFDPTSFKRRAVSPSISAHNSPVVQSPMQRDVMPWGSRPGSTGGDRGSSSTGQVSRKGRVGLQGMVDTNDGIMRMSIE
ncbi:uncharacterized protein T069G_10655 [Trichoderma breve]|uniref:Uncharacterized protein n=1 Tax=Trichoderma breve TaxID=2034170 RepID=A0A9W9E3G3_9HYPO|nr:uncharacterized protein T069G_10655 [Trichoderma breve]KAJ4855097.1 hypothetical protein T069G_10655 [Trichoderma breve]